MCYMTGHSDDWTIFFAIRQEVLGDRENDNWFAVQATLCIQSRICWWIAEFLWFVSACVHKIGVPNPFSDTLHLMSLKSSSEFKVVNLIKLTCRPSSIVDRRAGCYTESTGIESRTRHRCKAVRLFTGDNVDLPIRPPIIKWSSFLVLIVIKKRKN